MIQIHHEATRTKAFTGPYKERLGFHTLRLLCGMPNVPLDPRFALKRSGRVSRRTRYVGASRRLRSPLTRSVSPRTDEGWMSVVIGNYQASFDLFLKDLHEVLEFVEPVEANRGTFSHRIYGLLLRVCTDFESLSKDLLIDSGCKKSPEGMKVSDYRSLERNLYLEEVEVDFLPWRPQPLRTTPYANWTTAKPSLSWYKAYNTVKHNRDAQFSKASLGVLVEAGAGLFALIAKVSHFNWGDFCSWRGDNGKYTFWRSPFEMHGVDRGQQRDPANRL
jgi:hypothetical protein